MCLELVQMPAPEPGPEDVLVRVRACGICGSDVHGLDGSTRAAHPASGDGTRSRRRDRPDRCPRRRPAPGERVTFDSTIYCGQCFYCVRGEVNLCEDRQVLGVSPGPYRRHGAFAEYVVVPRRIVYRLPDNLSFEHAAMIEAVSRRGPCREPYAVHPGDTAVVVGSGMIGLLAIQALRHAGCARVIAVDPDPARLQLARQLGAASRPRSGHARRRGGHSRNDGRARRGRGRRVRGRGRTGESRPSPACARAARRRWWGTWNPRSNSLCRPWWTGQLRLQGSCRFQRRIPSFNRADVERRHSGGSADRRRGAPAEGPAWFDRLYRREPNLMKVI